MAGSNKTGKKSETKNEGMLGMTFRGVSVFWFESKKGLKIIMAVMSGLICILLFAAGYLIGAEQERKASGKHETVSADKELRGTVVNSGNVNKVPSKPEKARKAPANYEVIMNTEWSFEGTGKESLNAYVENSRDNTNAVRYLLSLEDEPDKVLFTSRVLEVGERISGIKLQESVPVGRNRAVVTYQLLDNDGDIVGEVKAGITLVREE